MDELADKYPLVIAFIFIGALMGVSWVISAKGTRNRIHGSAIAIFLGLVLAYLGGLWTGGTKGLADVPLLAGVGLLGGAMIRDIAIVATAMGVGLDELRRSGPGGVVALLVGVVGSFAVGAAVAFSAGYRDPVSLATLGAGAATYIVGPVTGTALGATPEVIALSIATGLVKSILVMIFTPVVARRIGLDNPRSAMVFGGLMGTTSGVAGGLAATDPKLVPYGAMTATFFTGLGCLLCPSILFIVLRWMV
nr:malonate transporter subunit MadM [Haloferula luteola]